MGSVCPNNYMISSGYGIDKYQLVSFDKALINAGISNYNLVRVSSILPAECKRREKVFLKEGLMLLVAYGSISSNEFDKRLASAISVAIPQNTLDVGIIMEYSDFCTAQQAEESVLEMAQIAMENHNIKVKDIICSSVEKVVQKNEFATVISAVSMW